MAEGRLPVITISREYCAGGRSIARGLAERFGLEFYDSDFVKLTSRISGFSEEDVMRAMDSFLRRSCDVDTEDTAMIEARDELCPQLEEYIHAHYKDVNLSLGMIGEAFGLTPKYLSTLYKSRTGRSLLEFINAVRIEQAQKLLSVPGMTIAQAAEEVGYASVKTFRRAYVRAEGKNPGKHKGE